MEIQSFVALAQNVSLLLAAVLLFDVLAVQRMEDTLVGKIVAGVGVGVISMAIMATPWSPVPGVIIDTRTVIIGLCGLFCGSLPTLIAVLISSGYRLFVGGTGAWPGALLIVVTAGIGLAWRQLREKPLEEISWAEFLFFGLIIHVLMLMLMLTLPGDLGTHVLERTWIPVLVLLPATTALMARFLVGRLRRVIMEEHIKEREETFSKAFSDHRAIQLLVDPETGAIIDANHAAESFYGWSCEELRRMRIQDINRLDTVQLQTKIDQVRREQEFVFNFEHSLADGSFRHVEVFSTRINVRGKDILHSIIHDVTDKTLAKVALQESERRLQLAVDATDLGLWDWDVRSGNVVIDGKWAEMIGYTLEELQPVTVTVWEGLCHPEDLKKAKAEIEKHFQRLTDHYECEIRMRHKDGHYIWVFDRGKVAERDEDGNALRMLGTHRNFTEQKEQREALKRAVHQNEMLTESTNDGILVINSEHRVVESNHRFAEMLGYTVDEIIGMPTWEYEAEYTEEDIREFFSDPSLVNMVIESRHLRKDGGLVDVEVSLSGANVLGEGLILAIVRDISERKRVQAELRREKEKAEAASKAKSEFLANMSHEIRTPMNGVLGMLQLIQTTDLDPEQSEYIATAIQSSKRLSRLLSDILDLSRVEAGKLTLQESSFDLGDSLRQVEELFEFASLHQGINLECRVDPAIQGQLVGDQTRLQQVLINLVGNAFKFTTDGTIGVEAIALSSRIPDTERILFVVSDTGTGIPDEKLGVLFSPFTQVHQGYTREFQGAGLGLSICRRLVELMGGSITLESVEGEGTSVYFSLTFGRDSGQSEAAVDIRNHPDLQRKLSILLAEDDRVNHIATKRLLEKQGHSVTGVGNGAEALEALRASDFELVLMDIQMPVMNGVDAIRAIRAGEAGEDRVSVPIVALTAYAMAEDEARIAANEIDGYLTKPFGLDELQSMLARLFS